MLIAKKNNKVLRISDAEEKAYQVQGFDIYNKDEKGKETIKLHGHGKTVPYEEHEKVLKELETLKAEKTESDTKAGTAKK